MTTVDEDDNDITKYWTNLFFFPVRYEEHVSNWTVYLHDLTGVSYGKIVRRFYYRTHLVIAAI